MSESDFEAALRAAVASEETTTEEVTEGSEESSSVEESREQPRGKDGKFIPKFEDEDVVKYIEKHGDLEKALKIALEQEKLIGRQGQELGELRKAVTEIRDEFREEFTRPEPLMRDSFRELIDEDPARAVYEAAQRGDDHAYEAALSAWYDYDYRAASNWDRQVMMNQMRNEIQEVVRPLVKPVQEQTVRHLAVQARRDLESKYEDFGDVMESVTEEEVSGLSPEVLGELLNKDPKAALELTYRWVKAARPARREQEQEEIIHEKRDSYVSTSSSRPAAETKDTLDKFKELMLSPEPTSVRHGLTE